MAETFPHEREVLLRTKAEKIGQTAVVLNVGDKFTATGESSTAWKAKINGSDGWRVPKLNGSGQPTSKKVGASASPLSNAAGKTTAKKKALKKKKATS